MTVNAARLVVPVLFPPTVARDMLEAFRFYEGRLRGSGKTLAPETRDLLAVAEVSLSVSSLQASAEASPLAHSDFVPALLTLDDVIATLNVSRSSCERLIRSGDLPVVHIGRNRRVRPADLAAFINALPATGGADQADVA